MGSTYRRVGRRARLGLRFDQLEARALMATHTWTGAAGSLWSDPANWDGGAPTVGDPALILVFPDGAANRASTNDLAGLTVSQMSLAPAGYRIGGQSIRLTGGILQSAAPGGPASPPADSVDLPIVFEGDQKLTSAIDAATLILGGGLSGSGTLSVDGAGTVVLAAGGDYAGRIEVTGGVFRNDGVLAGAAVEATGSVTVSGRGTVRSLTLEGGATLAPGPGAATFTVADGLTLEAGSRLSVDLGADGSAAASDRVSVGGRVQLAPDSVLDLASAAASPLSTAFAIIQSGGSSAVAGTFAGLAERSLIVAPTGQEYRISYVGGSGRDVVLTHIGAVGINLAGTAGAITYGESVTLTATVTPTGPGAIAGGSITFRDGDRVLGSVPITGTTASLTTNSLDAGLRTLTASYPGSRDNQAGTFVVTVATAATTTVVTVPPSGNIGLPITITAAVASSPPGSLPATGMATFRDGGSVFGTARLENGVATLVLGSGLPVGTRSITAAFPGDANYQASTSDAVALQVLRNITSLSVRVRSTTSPFGQSLAIEADATAVTNGTNRLLPSGLVTFRDGDVVLGTTTMANGVATLGPIAPLGVGVRSLVASFEGSDQFEPAVTPPLAVTIVPAPTTTTLAATLQGTPTRRFSTWTLSAVVGASGTPLGGTVTFRSGSKVLGTVPLTGGIAFLRDVRLPRGRHAFTATYSGDANAEVSVSGVVERSVGAVRSPSRIAFLERAYTRLVGRPLDAAGLEFWGGMLDRGVSPTLVLRRLERAARAGG